MVMCPNIFNLGLTIRIAFKFNLFFIFFESEPQQPLLCMKVTVETFRLAFFLMRALVSEHLFFCNKLLK